MTQMQKSAWYNLGVIALTLVTVLALEPLLGQGAAGGFGLLGLLGLEPLFFRKRRGSVVVDERDNLIRQRSASIGFAVFWLAFVAVCVVTSITYGYGGAVPVVLILRGVWYGLMIVTGTMSVATLVQYGRGRSDGD